MSGIYRTGPSPVSRRKCPSSRPTVVSPTASGCERKGVGPGWASDSEFLAILPEEIEEELESRDGFGCV